jgi:hypothetical protein
MPERKVPGKDRDPIRSIGAVITSCSGVGGAVTIYVHHGSADMALLIFGTMQIWGACDLISRYLLKFRFAKLFENVALRAAENPENEHLRTLLIDVASTCPYEIGSRIPTRHKLK